MITPLWFTVNGTFVSTIMTTLPLILAAPFGSSSVNLRRLKSSIRLTLPWGQLIDGAGVNCPFSITVVPRHIHQRSLLKCLAGGILWSAWRVAYVETEVTSLWRLPSWPLYNITTGNGSVVLWLYLWLRFGARGGALMIIHLALSIKLFVTSPWLTISLIVTYLWLRFGARGGALMMIY